MVRSWLLVLSALTLTSAAIAHAQPEEPASATSSDDRRTTQRTKKRTGFVKRDGQSSDNEQLGGEPGLSESPAADVSESTGSEGQAEDVACDLACIEAQLEAEEQKESRKKGTLETAEESGSLTTATGLDSGDAMSAEPSTTPLGDVVDSQAEARRLPSRLGPVRLYIGDTKDWIAFGFASQLEFDYVQQFAGGGLDKASTETLQFRRIRFTLSSSFIDGRIRSRFQINATPSAFELIDMWLSFTRLKFATVRIGQFKIPYDRYRAQSFAALSFIDWGPTVNMFGSERQIGAEVFARGGFLDLEYSFGIFTGVNARASHAVGITEVYGEAPVNPSSFGDGEIVTEFHPEIVGRVAKNFGKINTDTNSDVTGSAELRQSVGVGFAYDARPTPIEDLGLRLSAEWLAKIRHFNFNIVTYLAWFEPWETGKILFGPIGLMGETGYRFSAVFELAIRYNWVFLTPALRQDARSYADFRIATSTDVPAAIAQYGLNGQQRTDAELALATTAHIIGNSLKTMFEAAWQNQRWDAGPRNGLRLTIQLTFLF